MPRRVRMRFSDNRQVECTLRGIAQYPDHMDRTRREESVRRFPASQRARRAPRRPAADTSAVESAVVLAPTIENRPTPSASLRHTVGARNGAPRFAEAAGSRRALSSAVGCRRLPGRLVFSAAEHEVGPPPPRSGFGEISPKRRRHTLCAKAELFGAGAPPRAAVRCSNAAHSRAEYRTSSWRCGGRQRRARWSFSPRERD